MTSTEIIAVSMVTVIAGCIVVLFHGLYKEIDRLHEHLAELDVPVPIRPSVWSRLRDWLAEVPGEKKPVPAELAEPVTEEISLPPLTQPSHAVVVGGARVAKKPVKTPDPVDQELARFNFSGRTR